MINYYMFYINSYLLVAVKYENAVAMLDKVAIIAMLLSVGRICPDM